MNDAPTHDLAGEIPKLGPEHIPQTVVDLLREACRIAADYSGAFGDACTATAEKYKIKPKALRRYIVALEGDKLADAEKEAEDLSALIESRRALFDERKAEGS